MLTLIAVGALAATLALTVGLVGLVARARSQAVVDRAALAAVDVSTGAWPGSPCDQARLIVEQGGVQLVSCLVNGSDSRVVGTGVIAGVRWTVRAHAGLADGHP